MSLEINGPRIWFTIPIGDSVRIPITDTAVSSFIVMVLICTLCFFLGRNITKRPGKRQVLVEKVVTMLYNMVEETMGKHNLKFAPYIGALFMSSIFGSLISTTGFFRSSTADLSTTATWAIMTTLIVWGSNIRENGFLGWLKGFTEPIVVMTPMNIVSEIAQPIAMAFRHFGNVAGGSIITMIVYTALALASNALISLIAAIGVIPIILLALGVILIVFGFTKKKLAAKIFGIMFAVFGLLGLLTYFDLLFGVQIPILQFGIPAVLSLYFDLFSGFVQAFVFSLLSMVYIAGACPPPEEKAEPV